MRILKPKRCLITKQKLTAYLNDELILFNYLYVRILLDIIIINVINERARFFDVCKTVFISIDNITISISVFIVKRSNHELLLKKLFQHAARINSINMNNESFKMILYFLNEKKRINFLKISAEYINNKEKKSVFAMKSLNV